MEITKLTVAEYAKSGNKFRGVMFVFRNSQGKESGINFSGKDYEVKTGTDDEQFRVWKNIIQLHWEANMMEALRREDNDGIRTFLKGKTPAQIIYANAKGEVVAYYDISSSIWSKIGLVPTKNDLQRVAKDYKRTMHKAAVASYNVLGLRKKDYTNEYVDPNVVKTKKKEKAPKATAATTA